MPIKIVFVCLLDFGHLQIPISLAKSLLYRDPNNEIYFVVDEDMEAKLRPKCSKFKFLLFKQQDVEVFEKNRKKKLDTYWMENKERFLDSTVRHVNLVNLWKKRQFIVQDLIKSVEPDLIMVENLFNLPFCMSMKYKWVQIVSTSPLKISNQIDFPPMGSGVIKDFKWFTDVVRDHGVTFRNVLDEWYKEFGLVRKPSLSHIQASDLFNIYLYPKFLNYFEPNSLDGKWLQLSSTILNDKINKFIQDQGWVTDNSAGVEILTSEFLAKPGKTVLFSLGTLVSESVEVFDKILPALAGCEHKFIVSKGKKGDQFKLPENCIGFNNLNQLELLKSGLIDVFVTHAGNNSFTEAFYYAVPMVAIPIFGDQHDNGLRLETYEIGKKIALKDVTKERLNEAINFVANNKMIKEKMKEISKQVQNDNTMEEITDLIIQTCLDKN